jgi:dATP pyrophosphohydrolase
MTFKRPESVLVVVHSRQLEILLMERTRPSGFWQSVTGSLEPGESPVDACVRELREETGLLASAADLQDLKLRNRYLIPPAWRSRYAPGTTHNMEHVFTLQLASPCAVTLAPEEHRRSVWLPWQEAAQRTASWANRDAMLLVARAGPIKR